MARRQLPGGGPVGPHGARKGGWMPGIRLTPATEPAILDS
jgi:hypothetical protein